ncbi:MAG: hypothetical protein MPN21_20200 [Thermoanaerobaculia bacterium]|nr:hypothetical protein [Thermoanaerobaculia bacterium]
MSQAPRHLIFRMGPMGQPIWWWLGAAGVLVSAAAVRLLLFLYFPVFLTADSPDYIGAAEHIATSFDFTNERLRDWRQPGYPMFLASVSLVAGWSSSSVVAAQKLGGLLCVVLGIVAGSWMGWRVGSLALGAFLAWHPVYLLFEHMLMTEALFIQLTWIFTFLAIIAARRNSGALDGSLLGTALACCLLTRAPALFFCAPVVLGLVVSKFFRTRQIADRQSSRPVLRMILGLAIALLLVLGPWSYRNYRLHGTWSPITNNVQRTVLAYMVVHDVVEPERNQLDSADSGTEDPRAVAGKMVRGLGRGADAERRASEMVREQIEERPMVYLAEAAFAARAFLGLPTKRGVAGGRDISYWFGRYVRNVRVLHKHNRNNLRATASFQYAAIGRNGRVLKKWNRAGVTYLNIGRMILTTAFLFGVAIYPLAAPRPWKREQRLVLLFIASYAVVLLGHAALLAGKQRYALPWDGVQLFVVVGVLSQLHHRWLRKERPDDS